MRGSPRRTPRTNRRLWLAGLAVFSAFGGAALAANTMLGAEPAPASVRMVIDYGDGAQLHLTALPWREGMTVLDALSAAKAHRHGVTFEHRGSGGSVLITKIGDLKNEGDGKNWLYSVNDKPGEVSAGAHKLKAGDAVLWKFKPYDYNP